MSRLLHLHGQNFPIMLKLRVPKIALVIFKENINLSIRLVDGCSVKIGEPSFKYKLK
jgi:hypothetical protein